MDDAVLHTIKYSISNRCQIESEKQNSFFILHSASEIPYIDKFSIILMNNSNSYNLKYDNNKSNQYNYYFSINTTDLSIGSYFIEFNGTSFDEYKLIISDKKGINKIIGDLISDYNETQYFIIDFQQEINIIKVLLRKDNETIQSECELMFNNSKSSLCKIKNNISKGKYFIEYMIDDCDNSSFIHSEKEINVIENKINIPISQIYKYDKNNYNNQTFNFIFNKENDLDFDVSLINTTDIENEISINYNKELKAITINNILSPWKLYH